MECKFACTNHIEIRFIELIETLWNVNILLGYLHRLQLRELIETLWNVNCNKSIYHNYHHTELIETLWNVNINGSNLTHDERVGINRNIVECKYLRVWHMLEYKIELIETYWNVDYYHN